MKSYQYKKYISLPNGDELIYTFDLFHNPIKVKYSTAPDVYNSFEEWFDME